MHVVIIKTKQLRDIHIGCKIYQVNYLFLKENESFKIYIRKILEIYYYFKQKEKIYGNILIIVIANRLISLLYITKNRQK